MTNWSSSAARRRRRDSALTLVELLVVTSILIIVGSTLLPIVGRTADEARKVVCCANLRQIGIALGTYAMEQGNKGAWIPPRDAFNREQLAGSAGQHVEALGLLIQGRHVAEVKTFFCPAEAEKKMEVEYPRGTDGYYGNYLYFGGDADDRNRWAASRARQKAVASDLDICLGIAVLNNLSRTGKTHHGEGHNVLYLGGNVNWFPIAKTQPDNPLAWDPTFDTIDLD